MKKDTSAGRAEAVPSVWDLVELVRLPAVLTVPGDALAGAAAAGRPLRPGPSLAGALVYLAGMALNDYGDRQVDSVERPERPIPSGRVSAGQALGVAGALTTLGAGVATRSGSGIAGLALVGVVWSYDLLSDDAVSGPLLMGAARALDVLLGAGDAPMQAALPALVLAVHTAGVTVLSRGEVHGSSQPGALLAILGTTTATVLCVAAARPGGDRLLAGVAAGAVLATAGRAQVGALRERTADRAGRATGVGIRAMALLQAALLAGRGHRVLAAVVAAAPPVVARASRVVSTT